MLLSPRKNGLTSLFKEVRVFKGIPQVIISNGMVIILAGSRPQSPNLSSGFETWLA